MPAIVLAIIGLIVFALGYRYYSKFIAERIYRLDPNYQTPAYQFRDGVDFVPTNKWVLWGHHFTSVAGAAPIVGPAVAVYWGWLPAFLWVVLGTVFAAGVHDFGTLVLSVRNKGQSIGTLAERIIGRRAKLLFLFIILILVLMVNAVFAWVISNLFITFPASVLAVFIQIPLAIWIGYTVNKKGKNMLMPSLVALAVMYAAAVIASTTPALQIDLVSYFGGEEATGLFGLDAVSSAFLIWIAVLMIYVYIASILPVWKLLQPRDYINSHQLVVGLAILYLGLFFTWPTPEVTAPATREVTDVSWFPLLFITIACGAISGFHGLVSSGTSSKQLNKETDARFVGYFGAVGEGTLALVTILAVTTFFASQSDFLSSYESFNTANADGLAHFVGGAGQLATGLGLPAGVAETIVAVIVVSFAATTLDTSVRLMRYIISELGQEYSAPGLTKKHVATSIAVGASALLVLLPGDRGFGSGGYLLWPLFGTSNQLLAGISLLLISIWLRRKGRNFLFTFIPMIFLLFMTMWAMTSQVIFQWSWLGDGDAQILLFVLGAIILAFTVWILLEAIALFRREPPNTDPDND
ncbi:carbon starvation CstA family protein [Alteribacillus bidgolensis]|uniref:Carbon starvation protein n=1 Tax=Alteribacillus bidgolensis TaxID=930129 RepID=A0A1G8IPH9_9BACI|nr:carbon starvation protein A [Alteribacillus bidgolensis]SDI20752.1 carbon starvation protein [Alteribacillus bidgolensis]